MTVYGYWLIDKNDSPIMPEVSTEHPYPKHEYNEYRLVYKGNNHSEAHTALIETVACTDDNNFYFVDSPPAKIALKRSESDGAPWCYDCGLHYTSTGWMDMVVPNDIWEIISPSTHKGAGLLCPTCMMKRIAAANIEEVEVKLYSSRTHIILKPDED